MLPRTDHPFAIVTGASRGLGAAYARELAGQGYDLLLVARDQGRLEEVARELVQRFGVTVDCESIDLAQVDAARRLHVTVVQHRRSVDVLVLNAGFGMFGAFVEMPMSRLQDMLRLHVVGVIESLRLFLPAMVQRRAGGVIVVGSVAGFYSVPYFAEYSATKAFLLRLCEGIAEELRHTGVRMQICCPGSTETDFHHTAGHRPRSPFGTQTAEAVARASVRGLRNGPVVLVPGWQSKVLVWLSAVVPTRVLVRAAVSWMKPSASAVEGR